MQPLNPPTPAAQRLDFIDALRGFALSGVFGANLFVFSGYIFMTDAQRGSLPTAGIDKIVYLLEQSSLRTNSWGSSHSSSG